LQRREGNGWGNDVLAAGPAVCFRLRSAMARDALALTSRTSDAVPAAHAGGNV
jgi:hypothetical protein